jgi:hypothetical protein
MSFAHRSAPCGSQKGKRTHHFIDERYINGACGIALSFTLFLLASLKFLFSY